VNTPLRLDRSCSPRLAAACELLGAEAPASLAAIGDPALLEAPGLTALFCSRRLPGDLILPAYDLARLLREGGVPVIGGFHAPMEREMLRLLLRGPQPVIHIPARGLEGMRLSADQRKAIEERRLLLLSPFPEKARRLSATLAEPRNRLVVALAERVLIVHALPGGQVAELAAECLARGTPVHALPGAGNAHLLALGAGVLDRGG